MKARLGPVRSFVAVTVLLIGATPVASQAQAPRTPNPNAPRLVVGTFRSGDKKLSAQASEELRSRLNSDIPFRQLTVLSSADYKTVVEQSGYPYDEALTSGDLGSLAKLLRTDEYMEGTVEKTAAGFKFSAVLVLTRDPSLLQPLPDAEGDKLSRVAALMSKSVQDARKQIEFEKKCNMQGRDGKPAEAIVSARAGIAAYPQATLVRLCELQVRAGFKQPPDSIIAAALEVLKYDPKSKLALTYAAQSYKDKGDQDKSTEILIRLLATDPTNTRLVDDVVNALAASGKPEMAKPIISQAIKENPGDVRLMKLGFLVYLAAKDNKNGTLLGEEMIKIDTSLADQGFFEKMMAAFAADTNLAKALEWQVKATEKFPKTAGNWVTRSQIEKRLGQAGPSLQSLRRAYEVDPKAVENAHVLFAGAYKDAGQPDSALVEVRAARAAGEDKTMVGGMAVAVGDALRKVAKSPEEWLHAYGVLAFADSITMPVNKPHAKFLLGLAAYQLAAPLIVENQTKKSCEQARKAAGYLLEAQINLPAGGAFAPEPTKQLLGNVAGLTPASDSHVKLFCK